MSLLSEIKAGQLKMYLSQFGKSCTVAIRGKPGRVVSFIIVLVLVFVLVFTFVPISSIC